MSEYVPIEYPKWVGDTIVANRAEEDALSPKPRAKLSLPTPPADPFATDPEV